jgi:phytoene/squalene synthetase
MKINLNNQEILNAAKQIVYNNNNFTFFLAKNFIPSIKLQYFYCWYAYFRWVDDIADSNNSPLSNRILFMESQIGLVENYYSNTLVKHNQELGELFLKELIAFDLKNGNLIKPFIIQMLQCIQFDISRVGKYSPKMQLEKYYKKEVLSYLNVFQFFCAPSDKYQLISISEEGIAGKLIHILRDFRSDYNETIFNLPLEDINEFGFNPYDNTEFIKTIAFKNWVKKVISDAEYKFNQGKRDLRNYPSLKYKVIVLILCLKYQLYMDEIKKDGFLLKSEYKINNLSIIISCPRLLLEVCVVFLMHITMKFNNLKQQ